jgi:hypothetical protein
VARWGFKGQNLDVGCGDGGRWSPAQQDFVMMGGPGISAPATFELLMWPLIDLIMCQPLPSWQEVFSSIVMKTPTAAFPGAATPLYQPVRGLCHLPVFSPTALLQQFIIDFSAAATAIAMRRMNFVGSCTLWNLPLLLDLIFGRVSSCQSKVIQISCSRCHCAATKDDDGL